jgi:hypothetical protein
VGGESLAQRIAAVGRKADAKALQGRAADPALLGISEGIRAGGAVQLLGEPALRVSHDVVQRRLPLGLLAAAGVGGGNL